MRHLQRLALVAAGCAVVTTAAGARLTAAQSPPTYILFAATARGEIDIELFRVLPNGRHLQRLTRDVFHEGSPAWSPNRRRIAFTRYTPRATRCHAICFGSIWTMDADGKKLRRDTRPPNDGDNWVDGGASWSPNGRSLVFERSVPSETSIMTVARNGSHLRRIVALSDNFVADPAWGPTGLIAFVRIDSSEGSRGGDGIFVMRPDGSGRRKLIGAPPVGDFTFDSPIWNADGTRLAYAAPYLGRIYVVSAASGAVLRTIAVPKTDFDVHMTASRDFRTFAFDTHQKGIYLIGANGRNLRRLGAANAAMARLRLEHSPAWH